MNYKNFTDKGLQMMHDTVHKAIAAEPSPVATTAALLSRISRDLSGEPSPRCAIG